MKEHPNVHVDISSHTDSRADNNFNMILSQKRAESAIQYLIEHGIDKNRISGKGYGETKLLNKCSDGVKCTEEEHQLNRRTEMKIRYPNEENYPNKN
jgi:outer membrane protein OmpA-like peptidoglycan-associated protein